MTRPILVADCVGKRYGDRWVLRSASLRAEAGQLRALVGRNGTGNSTLMKIGAGLLIPDTGTVHFDGRPRVPARMHAMARAGMFFLPDHDLLSVGFTLREHLTFVRSLDARDGLDEVIDTFGLGVLLHGP